MPRAKPRDFELLPERAIMFGLYLVASYIFGGLVAGQWVPSSGGDGLWFLSVVALLAFRLLSAPFFPKPVDSLVAAITSALILWSLDLGGVAGDDLRAVLNGGRWISVVSFLAIAVCALIATVLRTADPITQRRRSLLRPGGHPKSPTCGHPKIPHLSEPGAP
jgi:hypothetical protein